MLRSLASLRSQATQNFEGSGHFVTSLRRAGTPAGGGNGQEIQLHFEPRREQEELRAAQGTYRVPGGGLRFAVLSALCPQSAHRSEQSEDHNKKGACAARSVGFGQEPQAFVGVEVFKYKASRKRTYSPRAAWCFAPAFTASDLCENYGVPKGTCPEDQGGGITRRAE